MPGIMINGLNLHYDMTGSGPPLLLLHGLGSSSQDWELQVPVFSRFFRVIALDLRGHGQSDKPLKPYSVPLMAADVIAFLQAMQVGPAAVVGLSMGGMVAYQLAVDFPSGVEKVVIINSVPELVPHSVQEWLALWQRLLLIRVFGLRTLSAWLGRRMFPKAEQQLLRDEFMRRFGRNDPRVYRRVFQGLVGWSVTDRLAEIQCPVLILSGERDYFSLEDQSRYCTRLPRAQHVVIPDSGHATPVDQPDIFNSIVLNFLLDQQISAAGVPTAEGPPAHTPVVTKK